MLVESDDVVHTSGVGRRTPRTDSSASAPLWPELSGSRKVQGTTKASLEFSAILGVAAVASFFLPWPGLVAFRHSYYMPSTHSGMTLHFALDAAADEIAVLVRNFVALQNPAEATVRAH